MLIHAKHKLVKLWILLEVVDPLAARWLQIVFYELPGVILFVFTTMLGGSLGNCIPALTDHPRAIPLSRKLLFWCRSAE